LVYNHTYNSFIEFKQIIRSLADYYQNNVESGGPRVAFEYRDKGEFQVELKFGGDVLIFLMHTNVFEFSRDHEVMKTNYIREDKERSYCGVIQIFNFLADSFKYNRENDLGYMIGRVFINKDQHYFIEGKRELGFLYNNFEQAVINREAASEIIKSAILYTINFDLLVPPFDEVKIVNVAMIQSAIESMKMTTGKRLGFRFQADEKG
jgi:hypothetical protein